jgi:site-specific DNA recombinase
VRTSGKECWGNKGPTACTNLRTIRRDKLEETVISALREQLMEPGLFKVFADEFTVEWNRLQGEASAEQTARVSELQRIRQRIERIVDAITEGTRAVAVRDQLAALEQRRLALETEAATVAAPAPRLHPNLAEVYRRKVAQLVEALGEEDGAEGARTGALSHRPHHADP